MPHCRETVLAPHRTAKARREDLTHLEDVLLGHTHAGLADESHLRTADYDNFDPEEFASKGLCIQRRYGAA